MPESGRFPTKNWRWKDEAPSEVTRLRADRDELLAALEVVVTAFPDKFQRWESLIARIKAGG